MTTLINLLKTIFRPRPAAATPALTSRTSPPLCPVCHGTGRAQVDITLPFQPPFIPPFTCWQFCRACGSAGVVPAVVLARDPGTSEELRRYAADYMRN